MADILEMAKKGIALIAQGREVLSSVRDAISDGKTALDADDLQTLQALLAQEEAETRAASSALQAAAQAQLNKGN